MRLDGLVVRLTSQGGGLLKIGFKGGNGDVPSTAPSLPGVETAVVTGHDAIPAAAAAPPSHPNTCSGIGEITLYARQLNRLVAGFASAGISTHRGKAPKALPGGEHKVAKYFFGQTRVLVTGPSADLPPGAVLPPPIAQMAWMFGGGSSNSGSTLELTGWLPVVHAIEAVVASCPALGVPKKAMQEGRTIATLPRGAVSNLTGTFAFLGDGTGKLNLT